MIRVVRDADELAREAAARIVDIGRRALSVRGRFDLLLAGGATPAPAYRTLAKTTRTDNAFWRNTHLYWGDERFVPADDPESNFRMARETLTDLVPIPPENVHPAPVETGNAETAAAHYEALLPSSPDLVLLGLGVDGHVASLFPGSDAVEATARRVVAVHGGKPPLPRITITPIVLNNAREVLVLVMGERKAEALKNVFAGRGDAQEIPGRLVRERLWIADRAASFLLREGRPSQEAWLQIQDEHD